MKVVIMAGGKGIRFWPRSVEAKPKQFLALTSAETMIQQTYHRFLQWLPPQQIYVATTRQYVSLVQEQLPSLEEQNIILEPEQRDTGPCIALIAVHFLQKEEDEVLVIAPSDQHIPDVHALMETLLLAEAAAHAPNAIVTLGIVPTRAETGFGYIETKPKLQGNHVLEVKAFIEKPSLEKATDLVSRPNIYWNSGIFVWKPSTIRHYMLVYQPEMWHLLNDLNSDQTKNYAMLPKISIDYAILEKAEQIYCIPAPFEWDDVGSWKSLERIHSSNTENNVVFAEAYTLHTSNTIIYAEHQKTVVIGVHDLIIVSTQEGLLICHKSNEQDIKKVLK